MLKNKLLILNLNSIYFTSISQKANEINTFLKVQMVAYVVLRGGGNWRTWEKPPPLDVFCNVMIRHSEIRFSAGPDRFRYSWTVLFREKHKKIGPKINLFLVEYLN